MIIGQNLASGVSLDDVQTWPTQIGAVTAEDVLRVARRYLDMDRDNGKPVVTGYLMPVVQNGEGE